MARLNALNAIRHFHDRVLVVHGVAHGCFSCYDRALVVSGVAHSVSHSVARGKLSNSSKFVVGEGHWNIFEKKERKMIKHLKSISRYSKNFQM